MQSTHAAIPQDILCLVQTTPNTLAATRPVQKFTDGADAMAPQELVKGAVNILLPLEDRVMSEADQSQQGWTN